MKKRALKRASRIKLPQKKQIKLLKKPKEIKICVLCMIFSIIQQNCNLKPNPYLVDTAKHLFTTAIGAAPAYIPALDEQALPLQALQKIFIDSYGLKKYIPTIMHPTHYNFEEDKFPVYYSLQNPSTYVFSTKSREVSSTLNEIRELEHIIKIFRSELLKKMDFALKILFYIKLQVKLNLIIFIIK